MESKTFEQWEEEKGFIVEGVSFDVLSTTMSEEDFLEIALADGIPQGVNHADRRKFLEDNGYSLTRENMINRHLSVRRL